VEKAVFIHNSKQLSCAESFERIYYGCEFCQNLIPTLANLKKVFSVAKSRKQGLTLVTPYVTTRGLEKIKFLIQYLDKQDSQTEVIFNDWGIFKLIHDSYRNLKPILGRLLTKQKRDPRAYNILLNKQKPRIVFDKHRKEEYILYPEMTPPSLHEHFRGSVINVPIFNEFLLNNNIKRVEIDNLVWDMKLEVDKRIGVSIYTPYAYVATTRLCGLINLTCSSCKLECQKHYFLLKYSSSDLPFYIWGNTVFYKKEIPKERDLREKGINRIVYNSGMPI